MKEKENDGTTSMKMWGYLFSWTSTELVDVFKFVSEFSNKGTPLTDKEKIMSGMCRILSDILTEKKCSLWEAIEMMKHQYIE